MLDAGPTADRAVAGARPESATDPAAGEIPVSCQDDADCGYDPVSERCGSDPRYNRQPPIVDQGIVCHCEASRCARMRVLPVPCESDRDCAVRPDPRPHPVRASASRPHERGRPCKDFTLSTTCERTNLCTMRRHRCAGAAAPGAP